MNNLRNAMFEEDPNYNTLMEMLSGAGPAPQPEQPMQLAVGNGLSFQTNAALMQLNKDMAPPAPVPVGPGVGTRGADSQVTREWRDRNAPAQNRQLEELLLRRRMLEQQLRGRR